MLVPQDMDAGQQVIGLLFQQRLIGNGAGCDHPRYLSLDRPPGQGRVADLFANGDRFTQTDQLCQVGIDGMVGHPRHGDDLVAGLAPGGEGDVKETRRLARIFEKQLVEITHAKEQQNVGIFRLEAKVLLHDRGMCGVVCWHQFILLTKGTDFKSVPGKS